MKSPLIALVIVIIVFGLAQKNEAKFGAHRHRAHHGHLRYLDSYGSEQAYIDDEEPHESRTKVLGRPGRSVPLVRCGRLFLTHVMKLCNNCLGSRFGRSRALQPEGSPYNHCCKEGCTDEFIVRALCCKD
ncbi:hypothetical protein QR680_008366 [Steinernema hermaphroditum]|uniref:Insulin-like domain-containing protein n=1 Tax=Steinernema hermaphroditum TaxID=289476 RepID=A0AA39IIR3_9BILA|nr:hypothetical protein QR680_008366 [Steinernema hermaphroditum]